MIQTCCANDSKWLQRRNRNILHRHTTANNEYMGTEFDPAKESKFISYLDVNTLYGWAMSEQLPKSGY